MIRKLLIEQDRLDTSMYDYFEDEHNDEVEAKLKYSIHDNKWNENCKTLCKINSDRDLLCKIKIGKQKLNLPLFEAYYLKLLLDEYFKGDFRGLPHKTFVLEDSQ